ncbi:hypothetical protein O4J56_06675 [Nocardiopsis sp. RSe5-2]|uniref:Uncharacterized protein n=1 Tax=Nocardiopsis endophytica TaxID=3018445 RepID=A0ABT4U041_9ACTN|nr:hypothetical protein [Nocardiopsis endophytica]MDA2810318.1 hypothetical protein [Nocardiopsis endophytica]
MNTDQAPAPAATGPTTQPNPRIRSVLDAPKGRRFNRARPYAELPRPAGPRPAANLRLPAHDQGQDRALPPWLARLHTELAPQEQNAAPPETRHRRPLAPTNAPAGPSPMAKKRKRLFPRGRLRRPRALTESARRWEGTRHACTVLGMLLTAYAIGLLG